MNRKGETLRWFKEAKKELDMAKGDFKIKQFSASCFWSQQSVEKALKAFLILKGETSLFEHSLQILVKRCNKYNEKFKQFEKRMRLLDKYYIPTRYPNGLPYPAIPAEFYSKEDAKEAIKIASEIINFVKDKLKNDTKRNYRNT